jgi:hypothetical protein
MNTISIKGKFVIFDNFYFYGSPYDPVEFIDENNKIHLVRLNLTTRVSKNSSKVFGNYFQVRQLDVKNNWKNVDTLLDFIESRKIIGYNPTNLMLIYHNKKTASRQKTVKKEKTQLDYYKDYMGNKVEIGNYVLFSVYNEKFLLGKIISFDSKRLVVLREDNQKEYRLNQTSVLLMFDEGKNIEKLKT